MCKCKEIFVRIKNVYGNELIYPNCDTTRLLIKLTGKKTFNYSDINTLKQIGYNVVQS